MQNKTRQMTVAKEILLLTVNFIEKARVISRNSSKLYTNLKLNLSIAPDQMNLAALKSAEAEFTFVRNLSSFSAPIDSPNDLYELTM